MKVENILIEGEGNAAAVGNIADEQLDISCSDDVLLNGEPNDDYVGMFRDVIFIDKIFIENR